MLPFVCLLAPCVHSKNVQSMKKFRQHERTSGLPSVCCAVCAIKKQCAIEEKSRQNKKRRVLPSACYVFPPPVTLTHVATAPTLSGYNLLQIRVRNISQCVDNKGRTDNILTTAVASMRHQRNSVERQQSSTLQYWTKKEATYYFARDLA